MSTNGTYNLNSPEGLRHHLRDSLGHGNARSAVMVAESVMRQGAPGTAALYRDVELLLLLSEAYEQIGDDQHAKSFRMDASKLPGYTPELRAEYGLISCEELLQKADDAESSGDHEQALVLRDLACRHRDSTPGLLSRFGVVVVDC